MPLRLTTVALPGHEATALVHGTSGDAAWHLSNHVLVEPECFAWGYILPDWKDTLDTAPPSARHYHRTQIRHTDGSSGQRLYDDYAAAIAADAADAVRLRWWARWDPPPMTTPPPPPIGKKSKRPDCKSDGLPRAARPVVVAIGLRALLMVFEKEPGGWVLKTAFVPGQGDPKEIAQADREHRPRSNTPPRVPRGHRPDETAALDEKWSDDQWYYYRVFRPALKFVRRQREDIRGANDEQLGRHYGLLNPRIPTELRTGNETRWLNFCRAMRGDPAAKTG